MDGYVRYEGGIRLARGNRLKACPTCGREYPPIIRIGGKFRQAMFDYIAAHPEGVSVWQVMAAVYANEPDGGPESHKVVHVMKMQINKKLEKLGAAYRIVGNIGGGQGALYRIANADQTN